MEIGIGDVFERLEANSCDSVTSGKVYVCVSVDGESHGFVNDLGDLDSADFTMAGFWRKVAPTPLNICSGMTYEEAQQLKPGDKVKVLFAASSGAYCPHGGPQWDYKWYEGVKVENHYDNLVGKVQTFVGVPVSERGVPISRDGLSPYFLLPWFCLQLVEKAPQVEEMTLEQVCKELGREVKIVKGEG